MVNPPSDKHQAPGRFKAFWIGIIQFFGKLFRKSPSAPGLPVPVAAMPSKSDSAAPPANTRASSALIKHQRFSPQGTDWSKATNTYIHQAMASPSQVSPVSRIRTQSPKSPATSPLNRLPPPASPFSNISLSGLFTSPPTLASPSFASDIQLGRLSPAMSTQTAVPSPKFIPGSPPPRRSPQIGSPCSMSSRSVYSRSLHTPRTPNSLLMIQIDRSAMSPTTMSDGSLQVISLGDLHSLPGTPQKALDAVERLPSPWSPAAAAASFDVWTSVEGALMTANGPVVDDLVESLDSAVLKSVVVPSLAPFGSKFSDCSLASSASSDLEIIDLSVYVDLDALGNESSGDSSNLPDNTDMPAKNETTVQVDVKGARDENKAPPVTLVTESPRKRRDIVLPLTKFQTPVKQASPLATKHTAPLAQSENIEHGNLLSSRSISSTTYELRLGLFGDERGMTAIENIMSFLDQASPESAMTRPHADHENRTAIIMGAEVV